eukprot:766421-Hanusia_phi.AAC.14
MARSRIHAPAVEHDVTHSPHGHQGCSENKSAKETKRGRGRGGRGVQERDRGSWRRGGFALHLQSARSVWPLCSAVGARCPCASASDQTSRSLQVHELLLGRGSNAPARSKSKARWHFSRFRTATVPANCQKSGEKGRGERGREDGRGDRSFGLGWEGRGERGRGRERGEGRGWAPASRKPKSGETL